MKEQIEKMARDLENHACMSQFQAEIASRMLYNEGWRKQKEGVWVYRENEFGNAYYACSICDCQTRYKVNYCSSCGAKMKGGSE